MAAAYRTDCMHKTIAKYQISNLESRISIYVCTLYIYVCVVCNIYCWKSTTLMHKNDFRPAKCWTSSIKFRIADTVDAETAAAAHPNGMTHFV